LTKLLSTQQFMTCQKIFTRQIFCLETINLALLRNEISGMEKQFAQDHLSTSEQERFFSFKYPKRQVEWLGGRLAAKRAVSMLLTKTNNSVAAFPDFSVGATQEGRPLLHLKKVHTPIDISISHSGNLAAALAVSHICCGLDIQEITKKILKVKSRFASPAEEQIMYQLPCLKAFSEETGLTMLWSAKEAFRKSIVCKPMLGFLDISLLEVNGTLAQGFIGTFTCRRLTESRRLTAFFTLSNTFAVAIT